jgi:hypothetical protein
LRRDSEIDDRERGGIEERLRERETRKRRDRRERERERGERKRRERRERSERGEIGEIGERDERERERVERKREREFISHYFSVFLLSDRTYSPVRVGLKKLDRSEVLDGVGLPL